MRIHPITLFLLLFPISGFSQVTPCYLAGGTVGFGDDNLKQDQLYFQFSVTGDTLVISPNENLRSGSYYRMAHNAPYMERTGTFGSSPMNYAWPPGATAYIMDNGYQIVRSYTGQVLNKNITGIIKFKQNGKCYIQWRDFGYECLGGGQL